MRFSRAFLVALASAAFAPSCFSFVASPSLPHALQRTTTRLVNDGIRDHRAHYAASQGQRLDMSGTINNRDDKNSTRRRRAIVVVGLNGALQRTIVFKPPKGLRVGDVNRASSVGAGIGGKGQNVCVALRTLAEGEDREDVDVTLAHFAGGKSGEAVCEGLAGLGVNLVTSETKAEMRLCTTLVDERFGETTEIIEPWSAEVSEEEQRALLAGCKSTFAEVPSIHGVAVMGSSPQGVAKETLVKILDTVTASAGFLGTETRVLVDSVVGFEALVDTGIISLLKVNAEEVVSLAESGREGESADGGVSVWMEDKLGLAAAELFRRHGERLPWIAVTNGGLPAYLYSRDFLGEDGKLSSFWRLTPAPVDAINPIGAGDAVAAATLYEWTRGATLPEAFRRGVSVGGATCTSRDTLCNSRFSLEEANRLLPDVRLEQIQIGQSA